jgi:hypothetical protein
MGESDDDDSLGDALSDYNEAFYCLFFKVFLKKIK